MANGVEVVQRVQEVQAEKVAGLNEAPIIQKSIGEIIVEQIESEFEKGLLLLKASA